MRGVNDIPNVNDVVGRVLHRHFDDSAEELAVFGRVHLVQVVADLRVHFHFFPQIEQLENRNGQFLRLLYVDFQVLGHIFGNLNANRVFRAFLGHDGSQGFFVLEQVPLFTLVL